MKRNVPIVATAAVAVMMACGVAHAQVQTNVRVPIAPFSVTIGCANGGRGEVADFSGTLHILISYTETSRTFSGKAHFQPQGATGIGEKTGNVYHATGVTQTTFQGSLVNGRGSFTYVNNFRIIGPGTASYLEFDHVHVTINANGTVTASIDSSRIVCR